MPFNILGAVSVHKKNALVKRTPEQAAARSCSLFSSKKQHNLLIFCYLICYILGAQTLSNRPQSAMNPGLDGD